MRKRPSPTGRGGATRALEEGGLDDETRTKSAEESGARQKQKPSLHDTVLGQFNLAADLCELDPDIRRILSATNNELVVHFPVRMDSGRIEVFSGYPVQHNNARGPYKGGTTLDRADYSETELEHITRRFTYSLGNNIAPDSDIPAPDVNTNAQIMAWILDTHLTTKPPDERQRCIHVVTGKPVEAGGSEGCDRVTGEGVY